MRYDEQVGGGNAGTPGGFGRSWALTLAPRDCQRRKAPRSLTFPSTLPTAAAKLSVRSRDTRFDSLRGLLLLCMAVNHVPSDWHVLTDRALGLFSAAEGFVFLSGLLSGIIYTRQLRTRGERAFRAAAKARAWRIYAWHLASFLAVFAAVQMGERWFGLVSPNSPRLFHDHPVWALGLGAVMLYQPGLLDILPMYCAFTLLLGWVLPALERRRYGLVLGSSFLLWVAMQGAPAVDGAPLYPIHFGSFNLFAWQFLFVLGVIFGHRHVRRRVEPARLPTRPVVVAGAAALGLYLWGIHHWQWPQPFPDQLFGILLNKPALGALRLVDFLLVAYLVALLGRRWHRLLRWPALAFLGRHSLAVMAAQTLAVALLLMAPRWESTAGGRSIANVLLVGVLFAGAWVQSKLERPRDRRSQSGVDVAERAGTLNSNQSRAWYRAALSNRSDSFSKSTS